MHASFLQLKQERVLQGWKMRMETHRLHSLVDPRLETVISGLNIGETGSFYWEQTGYLLVTTESSDSQM